MGCNRCHHSTCELSAQQNIVKPLTSARGFYILDKSSKPKWKVLSNNPRVIEIYFVADKAKGKSFNMI